MTPAMATMHTVPLETPGSQSPPGDAQTQAGRQIGGRCALPEGLGARQQPAGRPLEDSGRRALGTSPGARGGAQELPNGRGGAGRTQGLSEGREGRTGGQPPGKRRRLGRLPGGGGQLSPAAREGRGRRRGRRRRGPPLAPPPGQRPWPRARCWFRVVRQRRRRREAARDQAAVGVRLGHARCRVLSPSTRRKHEGQRGLQRPAAYGETPTTPFSSPFVAPETQPLTWPRSQLSCPLTPTKRTLRVRVGTVQSNFPQVLDVKKEGIMAILLRPEKISLASTSPPPYTLPPKDPYPQSLCGWISGAGLVSDLEKPGAGWA